MTDANQPFSVQLFEVPVFLVPCALMFAGLEPVNRLQYWYLYSAAAAAVVLTSKAESRGTWIGVRLSVSAQQHWLLDRTDG